MNGPTREQIDAAVPRTRELFEKFESAIREHIAAHPEAVIEDLACDTVTATVQLLTDLLKRTGAPPLEILATLASELGVQTITANSKSVGHG